MARFRRIDILTEKIDKLFTEEISKFTINDLKGVTSVANANQETYKSEIGRMCASLRLPAGWRYLKQVDNTTNTATVYYFRQEETDYNKNPETADVRILYEKTANGEQLSLFLIKADQYRTTEKIAFEKVYNINETIHSTTIFTDAIELMVEETHKSHTSAVEIVVDPT